MRLSQFGRRTSVTSLPRTERTSSRRRAESGRGLVSGLVAAWILWASVGLSWAATPVWLRYYGLQEWETALDHDLDGHVAEEEFRYGTDPFDPMSHPPQFVPDPQGSVLFSIEIAAGVTYGTANLQTSTNLLEWTAVSGFPPPAPATFTFGVQPDDTQRFFRFGAPGLLNSDGDCLLDFEELNLFFTDPFKSDTDGDGLDDCTEVTLLHSDPNRASPTGRGAISGQVVLDEDRDPATQIHPGRGGWTVFLDLNYDGDRDPNEPSAESQADGRYQIAELDPGFYRVSLAPQVGWTQIFPTAVPAPIPDGYPDRVVEVFDSGTGPIPFPYGRYVDPLPGLRLVFPSPPPLPVEASVVLGALPAPPIAGPFGGWAHVDILSIPTNSFVTVAFDGEEVVDGPGADLAVWCGAGGGGDSAEIYLGSTPDDLVSLGSFPQEESILIDLGAAGITTPIRYVKVRGLGLLGTLPGIDLVGFEALNYRPLTRGQYDVTVAAGQTVTPLNFGVAGEDRKPKIFVRTEPKDVRAGDTLTASVTATDDGGLTLVSLTANGVPVSLDGQGQGQVPVLSGGLLTLVGRVTDTANQSTESLHSLIARNADGSQPDLSGLTVGGGGTVEGPSLQIHSPVAGEILSSPHEVVGTIRGTAAKVASWQVHYAPADQVNPQALDAPDSDYVLLAEGTNDVIQAALGRLDGGTLPPGPYLLRIAASDIHGITTYLGWVIGIRIEPLDLRPEITLTQPTNGSLITYLTEIRGSLQTRQTLRNWTVEYAPLSRVNLQNLAAPGVDWVQIASGTNKVTDAVLATFDPTRLPNDSYVLRVSAWNENGLGWTEPLVVEVSGDAKLGNFAAEFTDLELPLAGIPITIKRVYDSLRAARSGDFGYGWTLALQEADLAETVPQTGSGFASTPFRVGTRVYLTAPDGKRVGFTFEPEIGAASLIGAVHRVVFRPDPGVRFTLAVPEGDSPFLRLDSTGTASLFFFGTPWNPDTYLLTDSTGTRFTYDQADGLIEIRDASDNRVTFGTDAIVHSTGQRINLTRDASGRLIAILAPDGRTWRYQYDGAGDLVKVTYPDGSVANLGYSAVHPHYLVTLNDPWQGPSSRTEYDDLGRVSAIIDAAGNRQEQQWDPGTFSGTHSDARGNVTRLTYDARGNVVRREDPLGGVTAWEFKDPANPDLPTARVDPRGARTTFRYNAAGRLLDDVRPLAQIRHTYDDQQNLIRLVHGTGGSETFTYDDRGKLLSVASQAGHLTFTYTAGGLLASLKDGEGGLTRLEYDGALRLPSRLVLPDGTVKHFAYDAVGNLVQYTDPSGGVTRQEYDSLGRLIRILHPDGTETRTTYDTAFPQQPATVIDRAGRTTRSAYDTLGRLVEVNAPGNAITRYEYDADGNRTALVDPLGQRYEFRYDALSRLIEEVDPLGNRRLHEYDAAGNRTASTDRNGRRRNFTYDVQNRLKEEHWLDVDGSVLRTITHTYDRADQLTAVSDPEASLTLGRMFVPNGPLLSEEVRYTGAPVRQLAFQYDQAIRRSGVRVTTTSPTLEPAVALSFTRDLAGRLRILTSSNLLPPSQLDGLAFQLQFWRTPRGDIEELRRFSDSGGTKPVSQSHLDYRDPCGCRLDGIEHRVSTNLPLAEATQVYTRNAAGQVTSLTEGTTETAYGYDAAGQLTSVRRNGTVVESYTYDANGNRQTSHLHADYTTGLGNRLLRAGDWVLGYDLEGNLVTKSNSVSGVVLTLLWDHRNRLTRAERQNAGDAAPVVTEYRYDPLDRRISVIQGGHTNWTYFDGDQPLVDFVDNEPTPMAIQFTGERLDELYAVWRRGKGLYWTLTDPLGTPRRLLDQHGVPVATLEFDSFGNPTAASGTEPEAAGRFGFTGREWDPQTGLYYYRARNYDPELGRFLSEDPLRFAAGDANLYRYVFNQPNTLTDPTGMVTAVEYTHLVLALARPGKFCRFAVCVNGLWSGIANAVINLVPSGPPDATCAAKLLGVPTNPTGAALALAGSSAGAGAAIYKSVTGQPNTANPVLGTVVDLAACAYEASR